MTERLTYEELETELADCKGVLFEEGVTAAEIRAEKAEKKLDEARVNYTTVFMEKQKCMRDYNSLYDQYIGLITTNKAALEQVQTLTGALIQIRAQYKTELQMHYGDNIDLTNNIGLNLAEDALATTPSGEWASMFDGLADTLAHPELEGERMRQAQQFINNLGGIGDIPQQPATETVCTCQQLISSGVDTVDKMRELCNPCFYTETYIDRKIHGAKRHHSPDCTTLGCVDGKIQIEESTDG